MAGQTFPEGRCELDSPAVDAQLVTPSDTTDLPGGPCRALLVGEGGDLRVMMVQGDAPVTLPIPDGYNPLRIKRVYATGTVADKIWALY